uniref:Uncharacterized protein n=1 Tax=Mus musculus TaxID=10090 RepID=Q8C520_MOUSE|nr:unnamed protein product [Mus musculus]
MVQVSSGGGGHVCWSSEDGTGTSKPTGLHLVRALPTEPRPRAPSGDTWPYCKVRLRTSRHPVAACGTASGEILSRLRSQETLLTCPQGPSNCLRHHLPRPPRTTGRKTQAEASIISAWREELRGGFNATALSPPGSIAHSKCPPKTSHFRGGCNLAPE